LNGCGKEHEMHEFLKQKVGEIVKIYLAEGTTFLGKVIGLSKDNQVLQIKSQYSDIYIAVPSIVTMSWDYNRRPYKPPVENPYHPSQRK